MIRIPLTGALLMAAMPLIAGTYRYDIAFEAASEELRITVCAPEDKGTLVLRRGSAGSPIAPASGEDARWIESGRMVRFPGARCGAYRIALGGLADSRRIGRGFRVGDDLLVWQNAWLWWPVDRRAQIEAAVAMPAGWHFSAPWPRIAGESHRYRLDAWPRAWPGIIALTRRAPAIRYAGRGALEITLAGAIPNAQETMLIDWVVAAAGLLDPINGGLPLPRVQVLVVGIGGGRGAVPWAQVLRAGTGGVHFFVDATRPAADFRRDWTAAHEFAHLMHPYLGNEGRWMGEGLASYYQNLLLLRAGEWDEARFWSRLLAGFERGRRGRAQDLPLSDAAVEMRALRANMRVYWSGAAYWLSADVALREASAGTLGLDDALAGFAACCLPAERRWTPTEFAARLDRITGHDVFLPMARSAAMQRGFPDIDALLDRLGVERDARGRFSAVDDDAPASDVRRSLVAAARSADLALEVEVEPWTRRGDRLALPVGDRAIP